MCVCVCNSLRLLAKTFKQSLIVLAGWSGLGLKPSPAFLDCCLRPGTSPCYPVTSGTSTSNALRDQARRPRKPLSLQAWRIYKERRKCMEAFKPRQRFHGKSHWRVWRHHLKRHVRQSSTISNSRHPLVVSCRKCKGWRLEMSAYVLRHLLAAIDKSLLGIFHQHLFSWPLVASIAETGAKWIQEEHGMIKEWRWVPHTAQFPFQLRRKRLQERGEMSQRKQREGMAHFIFLFPCALESSGGNPVLVCLCKPCVTHQKSACLSFKRDRDLQQVAEHLCIQKLKPTNEGWMNPNALD